jgi:UDP-glucose 4-epimerase
LRPISLYGAIKVWSEQLVESARDHSVLDTTILRCGNVYGPGQRPRPTHGVIAHALEAALDKRSMPMIGCLESVRDYVYIDDVVSVILACVCGDVRAPVLNVGSGIGTSLHHLFDTIRSITGSLSTTQGPPRAADISSIVLDIAALRRQMPNFEPTALEVGLERTWQAWSRAQSMNTNMVLGSRALESRSVHRPNLEHLGVL